MTQIIAIQSLPIPFSKKRKGEPLDQFAPQNHDDFVPANALAIATSGVSFVASFHLCLHEQLHKRFDFLTEDTASILKEIKDIKALLSSQQQHKT
jgi:hypothetical protein